MASTDLYKKGIHEFHNSIRFAPSYRDRGGMRRNGVAWTHLRDGHRSRPTAAALPAGAALPAPASAAAVVGILQFLTGRPLRRPVTRYLTKCKELNHMFNHKAFRRAAAGSVLTAFTVASAAMGLGAAVANAAPPPPCPPGAPCGPGPAGPGPAPVGPGPGVPPPNLGPGGPGPAPCPPLAPCPRR